MTDLPVGWASARLGDLCAVLRGVTYDKRDARTEPAPGLMALVRATNITDELDLGSQMVYVPADVVSDSQRLRPMDIVVASSSGSTSVVGKSQQLQGEWDGAFGAFCTVIRTDPAVDPGYIGHFVRSRPVRDRWSAAARGTNINNLKASDIASTLVPIPPRPEQERIVAAIEEAFARIDAGMAALERVRRKLKQMRAAVLQAAVTGKLVSHNLTENTDAVLLRIAGERVRAWKDHTSNAYKDPAAPDSFPLAVPNHWRIASLEAITHPVRVICYGILMPKENIIDGIPYVRVKDMKGWTIDVAGLKRTSRKIADQYARASLKAGDLLLAIRGSYGRVAIIPTELDGANITQDSARIAAHEAIDRRYLLYYLGGSVANRYYHRVARGVAVKGVNIGDLRSMPVPVPPHDEQTAIADEVERHFTFLDQVEVAVEAGLRRGSSLRAASLLAAFSGRLVPQNPKDEPASLLVERIAAERASLNGKKTPHPVGAAKR